MLGYLAGAIYSLRLADEARFEPRVVVHAGALDESYALQLDQCFDALADGRVPPRKWQRAFHFHSAAHRIAACADRLTKERYGRRVNRDDRTNVFRHAPVVEDLYEAVNRLKHDVLGLTEGGITMDQAIDALAAEIAIAQSQWPARRSA